MFICKDWPIVSMDLNRSPPDMLVLHLVDNNSGARCFFFFFFFFLKLLPKYYNDCVSHCGISDGHLLYFLT